MSTKAFDETLEPETKEDHQYIATAVGDLLEIAPLLNSPPNRANIALIINRYIQEQLNGSVQKMADRLRMHRKSVHRLRDGSQLPQLNTLLKLCRLTGISPVTLLTSDIANVPFNNHQQSSFRAEKGQKRYRRLDKQAMKQTLEARIAQVESDPESYPLSMSEIAKQLGYNHSFLYRHFPELCQTLSERYARYRQQQVALRQQQLCERVKDVARELHRQGIFPSQRQIGKLLGRGIFKDSAVQAVYENTMQELGYE